MENIDDVRKIEIRQETLNQLNTTRKWAMFLAISGFIFLGLFIIIGAITGTFLKAFTAGDTGTGITESVILIIVLALAVIDFFPIFFLFRFSKHSARAIESLDKLKLHKAIKNLKFCFIYIGVMIIIVLCCYIVALIVSGTSITPF
jgi:hypothetical protein